jgi:hypothetical protein
MSDKPDVQIIKATNKLQVKAGVGEVDAVKIERAEHTIQHNTENFAEIGKGFLDRLNEAVEDAHKDNVLMKDKIDRLTKPVMELKANARMFKYELVSELANIILDFLENIDSLDKDAIDIVAAHQKTLNLIISKNMKGDCGATGELLRKELADACQRYFKKQQSSS